MKPCYLNAADGLRVELDGPALRVSLPQRAATLYPLARISRVIASGDLDLSTAALLACAERGITVTFLDRDGRLRAYLFGESTCREGLFLRLRDLLDRPDWQDRYGDWRRAMHSRARRALARQAGIDPAALAQGRLEALLAGLRRRYGDPRACRRLDRRLEGLLAALVAELLAGAGLGAERARSLDERLDLAGDLRRMLAWDLHLPALQLLREGRGRAPDDRRLTDLFERRAPRLRRLGRSLLNRLHGWLLELD